MDYEDPAAIKNRDFERVVSLGVYPEIKTPQDYEVEVAKGIQEFRRAFKNEVGEISPEMVQDAHSIVFGSIHPWAGEFRDPGHDVLVGGRFLATDAPLVKPALEMLYESQQKVMGSDPSYEEKCEIIAKFHCEFENIHPFADGNGRLGRLLMEHQMNVAFGEKEWGKLDFLEYNNALKAGNRFDYKIMAGLIDNLVKQAESIEQRTHLIEAPKLKI